MAIVYLYVQRTKCSQAVFSASEKHSFEYSLLLSVELLLYLKSDQYTESSTPDDEKISRSCSLGLIGECFTNQFSLSLQLM